MNNRTVTLRCPFCGRREEWPEEKVEAFQIRCIRGHNVPMLTKQEWNAAYERGELKPKFEEG